MIRLNFNLYLNFFTSTKITMPELSFLFHKRKILSIKTFEINIRSQTFGFLNPHTSDRFTFSHARCAENCGSALSYR